MTGDAEKLLLGGSSGSTMGSWVTASDSATSKLSYSCPGGSNPPRYRLRCLLLREEDKLASEGADSDPHTGPSGGLNNQDLSVGVRKVGSCK